jgi:hypothetical protein
VHYPTDDTAAAAAVPAQVIWDMKARPDSPDWLVEETARIRKGLLTLRQNLVLVTDPENPEALYPRCACSSGIVKCHMQHVSHPVG